MRNSIITALILAVIGVGWIASGQFGTECQGRSSVLAA